MGHCIQNAVSTNLTHYNKITQVNIAKIVNIILNTTLLYISQHP